MKIYIISLWFGILLGLLILSVQRHFRLKRAKEALDKACREIPSFTREELNQILKEVDRRRSLN